jgi:hypothetical protein
VGKKFKTKPKAWNSGEEGNYFACIQDKHAYLTISLFGETVSYQEADEEEDGEGGDGGQADAEGQSDDGAITN